MGKDANREGERNGGGILDDVLDMQNSLPTLGKLEAKLESLVDKYVDPVYETMGQHYYSVSFGMFLGAAVATGVFFGGFMILSSFHPAEPVSRRRKMQSPLRSFCRAYVRRARRLKIVTCGEDVIASSAIKQDGEGEGDDNSKKEVEKTSPSVSSYLFADDYNCVLLLRGDVGFKTQEGDDSASNQCEECLNNLSSLLAKHDASWKDVRKLVVYLVSQQCNAYVFRSALQEFPLKWDSVIITLVFVERLEQEGTGVQVEAIVHVPNNPCTQ